MKILLTGGGTGGHFYPLIAIAEKLLEIAEKEKIVNLKLYYMSDSPFEKRMLFENKLEYIKVPSGKIRTYRSIYNFLDKFSLITGAIYGLINMFFIFPDVIISKGGYAAFPAVFAAKILRIPVIIHESDSYPGRLNLWTAKFAKRIAVSWSEAAEFLPKERTVLTGQPIRKNILEKNADKQSSCDFFKLSPNLPTVLVLGGSQGAQLINNRIIDILPELLTRYQVIHQTGANNIDEVESLANLLIKEAEKKARYVSLPYLNNLSTRMAAGCADLIISRAGSAIFEIASWGIPSIIIPITNSNGDHQRKNAYNYARLGACEVIEELNLSPHVLIAEIDNLLNNKNKLEQFQNNAKAFANKDAAEKIASEALKIALEHEVE
jgi:UDP-N-acetylglucosamine--N-acetylmuramyl-(pentapeptide) pyrophosphoryl-undecaprenol N-acetylglucosamine transferase